MASFTQTPGVWRRKKGREGGERETRKLIVVRLVNVVLSVPLVGDTWYGVHTSADLRLEHTHLGD